MYRLDTTLAGILLLLTVWASPLTARTDDAGGGEETAPQPQKRALLIGINDYAFVSDLAYCGRDIQSLREPLIAAGFPDKNVVLLRDGSSQSKYQPFKTNIERELETMLKAVQPGDLILVAFSGHGVHLDETSYLCPIEAQLKDPEKTLVSLEHVYERMSQSPAGQRLLLVDACRNDPRPGGTKSLSEPTEPLEGFSRSLETPPQGILSFTSCKPGQVSVEDSTLRHGVFMHYVLEGLGGDADRGDDGNRDERISLLELYNYASLKTRTHAARTRNLLQTPMLRGEISGVYEIGVALPSRPDKLPSRFYANTAKSLDQTLGMDPEVIIAQNPQALLALKRAFNLILSDWPTSVGDGIPKSDCDMAVEACNEAIRLDPQNAFAYLLRGIAFRKRGDYIDAMIDLGKVEVPLQVEVEHDSDEAVALKLGPETTGTVKSRDRLTVDEVRGEWLHVTSAVPVGRVGGRADEKDGWLHVDFLKAELQELQDRTSSSYIRRRIAARDRLEEIEADDPAALDALQRAHDLLAEDVASGYAGLRNDITDDELDRAIVACDEAIKAEPDNRSAHQLRGLAYREKGDWKRALADLQKGGKPLQMSVTARSIELKTAKEVTGDVTFGDTVNITQINGEWFWADSVLGQEGERGWIKESHLQQRDLFTSRALKQSSGYAQSGGTGTNVRSYIRRRAIDYARGYIPFF